MIKLFVGLGNPVRLLKDTRHNVGYMVIDRVLDDMLYDKHETIDGLYQIDCNPDRWVMKPQCDINLSYVEIQKAMYELGIKAEEVCVFYDEMQVLFSYTYRTRAKYTSTHKAMININENIGLNVMRYEIGTGECPEGTTIFNFVLGDFDFDQRVEIDRVIKDISKKVDIGINM